MGDKRGWGGSGKNHYANEWSFFPALDKSISQPQVGNREPLMQETMSYGATQCQLHVHSMISVSVLTHW